MPLRAGMNLMQRHVQILVLAECVLTKRREARLVHRQGAPGADTTTAHGRLMLTVLGRLAEFERELIRACTGEGRVRAEASGVKFGRLERPRRLVARQQPHADALVGDDEILDPPVWL